MEAKIAIRSPEERGAIAMTKAFITLVTILAGACVPGEVEFRARLAEGCSTQHACDQLEGEAEARFAKCINASSDGRGCNVQMDDRFSATALKNKQREAEDKAIADRNRMPVADGDDEPQLKRLATACASCASDLEECSMGLHIDFCAPPVLKLGSSCADLAVLEAAAKSRVKQPSLAADYRNLAQSRREARVRSITREIGAHIAFRPSLADMPDPGTARENTPAAQKLVDELRCYDAAAAARSQTQLTVSAGELESAISDEEKCRATPRCMGERETARLELVASQFAGPLCEAIQERRETLEDRRNIVRDIARERGNPAGVVDLNLLHDLGERIQNDDETVRDNNVKIAELRTKYTAVTHRAFSEASCPKTR